MIDNILQIYDKATSYDRGTGRCWYQAARQQCQDLADRYGIDVKRVVYAVAALSPQLKWERNIAAAKAVIQGRTSFPGVYTANIEKAAHILWDAEDWERWLSGPKVTSFAANILGDPEKVCVDTWAWRIWAGADIWAKPQGLDRQYDQIEADYQAAAHTVGLEPRQLQAITWTTIRRLANGRAAPGQLSLDI